MNYLTNIDYPQYKRSIDTFIKDCENKVNASRYTNSGEETKFKKRIVKYYIVPICYLIYSFIYTKYFKSQMQKEVRINNDLNYDMYKYFFNDGNPIIKKVNVQLYKQFQGINKNTNNYKNRNKNTNKNTNNDVSKMNNNITKEKKDITVFLTYIKDEIVRKNNYETKIKDTEEIVSNFKNLVLNMHKIYKILGVSTTSPLLSNNIIKKNFIKIILTPNVSANITVNSPPTPYIITFSNYPTIKDELEKIKSNTSKSEDYKSAFELYKYIITNILPKINDKIYKTETILTEDDITVKDIFTKYSKFLDDLEKYKTAKSDEDKIIDSINNIINDLEEQNEAYRRLFQKKSNKYKNQNRKSNTDLIEKINTNILKNISEINKILSYPSPSDLNNFIISFFQSFEISENIEFYYFKSEKSTENIDTITDNRIKFSNDIRDYIKTLKKKKVDDTIYLKNKKLIENEIDRIDIELKKITSKNSKNNINKSKNSVNQLISKKETLDEDVKECKNNVKIVEELKDKFNDISILKSIYDILNQTPVGVAVVPSPLTKSGISGKFWSVKGTLKMTIDSFNDSIKTMVTKYGSGYDLGPYELIETSFSKSIKNFNNKFFYDQVDEIYEKVKKDCNIKEDDLKKETTKIETERKKLSKRIESFQKREFYTATKTSLETLQTEMKAPSTNNSKNVVSNLETFKRKFLDIFDELYKSAESYEKNLGQSLKKSINNLKFYYDKDKSFTEIIDKLKTLNSTTDINDLTKKLGDYYAKRKFIFLDYLEEEIIKKNQSKELEPFYTKYKEMCEELNQKIETLLNNINKGITELVPNPSLSNFIATTIKGKINNCKKITNNDNAYATNKNHKKGKYIEILKYTDFMLYYIIDLLMIIDYLTNFYG